MPKNTSSSVQISRKNLTRGIVLLALIIFVSSGWLWWQKVYTSPERVFWSMLNNNLATNSITKHTQQPTDQSGAPATNQYTRTTFGAQNASRSLVTLSQGDGKNKSVVKTESIGTPENDFSRYIKISTTQKSAAGAPLNFTKIEGIWGKSSDPRPGQSATVNYLKQAVIGIVPFANFNSQIRNDLVSYMQNNNIYKPDFSKVKKTTANGKSVYVYPVTINLKPYVTFLQKFTKNLGIGQLDGVDPAAYADSPPVQAEFVVDKVSRQLLAIRYSGTGQEENYSDYGLSTPIKLPTQTISLDELQNRIQSLQ